MNNSEEEEKEDKTLMQNLIANIPNCEFGDFVIPSYSITEGCLIRFWVQKPTINTNSHKVNELMDFIQSKLKKKYKLNIDTFPIPFKKSYKHWFKSYRVRDFTREWNLEVKQSLRDNFDLKDHYKVQNLGYNQLKLLALLKLFSKKGICIIDFYGVDPMGEIHLTNYIKSKLGEGQTILAFDDLNFDQREHNDKHISNIEIKRKK